MHVPCPSHGFLVPTRDGNHPCLARLTWLCWPTWSIRLSQFCTIYLLPKKFGSQKVFGPEKCWVRKNFVSEKIFDPTIYLLPKKFGSQKLFVQTFFLHKTLGPKKFWAKNILGPKQFWSQTILGPENFKFPRILSSKTFGSKES